MSTTPPEPTIADLRAALRSQITPTTPHVQTGLLLAVIGWIDNFTAEYTGTAPTEPTTAHSVRRSATDDTPPPAQQLDDATAYQAGRSYSSAEISRRIRDSAEQHERETVARRALAGDPNPTDADPLAYVYEIAGHYAQREHRPDYLAQLADELTLTDVRALRLAGEAAVAVTPRMITAAERDDMTPQEIAADLGLTLSRVYQIRRAEQKRAAESVITRVAYDFGAEGIHIMDIDAHGVHDPESVEILPATDDRDEALADAGYSTLGGWTQQGEAEGITVEKQ